jgi:hypothetical protein
MYTFNGIGTTIYGRAKRQKLSGAERLAAEQAGYLPESYQVVKWFVLLFMPLVPLGNIPSAEGAPAPGVLEVGPPVASASSGVALRENALFNAAS